MLQKCNIFETLHKRICSSKRGLRVSLKISSQPPPPKEVATITQVGDHWDCGNAESGEAPVCYDFCQRKSRSRPMGLSKALFPR